MSSEDASGAPDGPVFLDSNVFIYAAGKPHHQKKPCVEILEDVESGAVEAVVNTEILQELLFRYHRIDLPDRGVELCRQILEYPLTVLPVDEDDVRRAIDLFETSYEQGIRARDAIHAATMQNHGIGLIVSADKHFDDIAGIQRIDPMNYSSPAKPQPDDP